MTAASAALAANEAFSAHRSAGEEGRDSLRPALPFINLAAMWLLAALVFGFPAIIIPALCAVAAMFYVLIQLTLGKIEVS